MNLGMLLAGQKGQLYKVATQNEKALRDDRREKLAELRKLKEKRMQKGPDKFVPPSSWKDEPEIIQSPLTGMHYVEVNK